MHTMPSHNWDQRLARATALGRDLSDIIIAPGTLPRRHHACRIPANQPPNMLRCNQTLVGARFRA
jgi:hypothetical protein